MENSHKKKSLEQRLKESSEILRKHPDRICVYLEKQDKCKMLPNLDKNKYLVPNSITAGQFMYVIRKRITLGPEQAIFLFVKNTVLSATTLMSDVYEKYKNEDGFLYITFSGENCFGGRRNNSLSNAVRYSRKSISELGLGIDTYRALISMEARDLNPNDYDVLLRLHLKENKKTLDPSIIEGFTTLIPDTHLDKTCNICMDTSKNDKLVRLPCKAGHIYHLCCIREWLTTASTCCPTDNEDLCEAMEA